MPKQKWINEHAMEDWELENTLRASRINEEYWRQQDKEWEVESARNIMTTGTPWKDDVIGEVSGED